MKSSDDPSGGPVASGPAARESLEARLLPLVRRALRSRTGLPALVGWVHRNVAVLQDGPQPDPDRIARRLSRLLCDLLLHRDASGDHRNAETVCGP
jgi:hypothetical protein